MAGAFIAAGVLVQVLLVVVFSIPPFSCGQDLRHDPVLPPLLIDLGSDLLGDLGLFIAVCEDARSVLRSAIRPLAVDCGRVVHAVEELEDLLVGNLGGVVDNLCRLSVCAHTSLANLIQALL